MIFRKTQRFRFLNYSLCHWHPSVLQFIFVVFTFYVSCVVTNHLMKRSAKSNSISLFRNFKINFVSSLLLQKLPSTHCPKWWTGVFTRKYRQFNGKIRQNRKCYGWNDIDSMPIDGSNGKFWSLFLLFNWNVK